MNVNIEHLLPSHFNSYSPDIKSSLKEYINQLSDVEKKACMIAKEHLGSSFNIIKSNGYNDWLKSKK